MYPSYGQELALYYLYQQPITLRLSIRCRISTIHSSPILSSNLTKPTLRTLRAPSNQSTNKRSLHTKNRFTRKIRLHINRSSTNPQRHPIIHTTPRTNGHIHRTHSIRHSIHLQLNKHHQRRRTSRSRHILPSNDIPLPRSNHGHVAGKHANRRRRPSSLENLRLTNNSQKPSQKQIRIPSPRMQSIVTHTTGAVGSSLLQPSLNFIIAGFRRRIFLIIFALGAIGLLFGFKGADFTVTRRPQNDTPRMVTNQPRRMCPCRLSNTCTTNTLRISASFAGSHSSLYQPWTSRY